MKKFLTFTCNNFLQNKARLLCTTSSGQDSTLNFFLLLHAKEKKNLYLTILYCQHFWQTKNFFSVLLLYKLSFSFEIPYHICLPQNGLGTENQSRVWRKKVFSRVSKFENSLTLLTGQTLTDKSENMFQNLLRGTSPKGLYKSKYLTLKKSTCLFFSAIILKPTFYLYKSQSLLKKLKLKEKKINLSKIENQYKTKFLKNQTFLFQHKLNLYFYQRKVYKESKKVKKNLYFFILKQGQRYSINPNLFLSIANYCFFSKKSKSNQPLSRENVEVKKNEYLTFLIIEKQVSVSFCFYSNGVKTPIIIKKPLLETTRFTISKFRKFYNFPIITDMTNFSSKISRNKIRYNLFPLIRYLFLPNFEFLLNNFLKNLEKEQNTLKKDVEEKFFFVKNKKLKSKQYWNRKEKVKIKNKIDLKKLDGYFIQKLFSNLSDIELTYNQTYLLKKIMTNN